MVFCLHTCMHMDMCQAVQLIARMVKSGGYKAKPAVSVLYVKSGHDQRSHDHKYCIMEAF